MKYEDGLSHKIAVAGIGGAGINAVNHMIGEGVGGVEFIGTDMNWGHLDLCKAETLLRIGRVGVGMTGNQKMGEAAAEESREELADAIKGFKAVIITCGMGGGTGTGASPVVAKVARDMGITTFAVVTRPFYFDGEEMVADADGGIEKLGNCVDKLVVIESDKMLEMLDEDEHVLDAFIKLKETVCQAIQDLIAELRTKMGEAT